LNWFIPKHLGGLGLQGTPKFVSPLQMAIASHCLESEEAQFKVQQLVKGSFGNRFTGLKTQETVPLAVLLVQKSIKMTLELMKDRNVKLVPKSDSTHEVPYTTFLPYAWSSCFELQAEQSVFHIQHKAIVALGKGRYSHFKSLDEILNSKPVVYELEQEMNTSMYKLRGPNLSEHEDPIDKVNRSLVAASKGI